MHEINGLLHHTLWLGSHPHVYPNVAHGKYIHVHLYIYIEINRNSTIHSHLLNYNDLYVVFDCVAEK